MADKPTRISVAKVPQKKLSNQDAANLLATLCYYYPQYTYSESRKLPYKRVMLLIRTAQKIDAMKYYNLTQIVAAPHTKDGKGVQALLDKFQGMFS